MVFGVLIFAELAANIMARHVSTEMDGQRNWDANNGANYLLWLQTKLVTNKS